MLNSLRNDVLGDSPYRLMFGVDSRIGIDHIWSAKTPLKDLYKILIGKSKRVLKYKEEIQMALKNLHCAAEEKMLKTARYYNKSHRLCEYQVGDKVMYKKNILSNKEKGIMAGLEARYNGPCLIVDKNGDHYKLRDLESGEELKHSYNVSRLKKCNIRDNDGYISSSEPSGDSDIDQDECESLFQEPKSDKKSENL